MHICCSFLRCFHQFSVTDCHLLTAAAYLIRAVVLFLTVYVCVCVQFIENADQGEDEKSVAAHVAMLAVQAAKKDPEMTVISARMEKTYADRRAMVYSGISTRDIVGKYPTLKFTDQVRCFVFVFMLYA